MGVRRYAIEMWDTGDGTWEAEIVRTCGMIKVIASLFNSLDSVAMPGVLVRGHGPFTWGKDAQEAAHNGVVLEEVAMMAYHTVMLRSGDQAPIPQPLLDKHYARKHGSTAYYGQNI